MSNAFVQVAPDSSGKKIRNVSDEVGQPDGTVQTVYSQAVKLSSDDRQLLQDHSLAIRRLLAAMILGFNLSLDDIDAMAANL